MFYLLFLFVLIVFCEIWFVSTTSCILPTVEYYALIDLFNSTNGEDWVWKTPFSSYGYPWKNTTQIWLDPCNTAFPWQGIQCNATISCHVQSIDLTSYGLQGKVEK